MNISELGPIIAAISGLLGWASKSIFDNHKARLEGFRALVNEQQEMLKDLRKELEAEKLKGSRLMGDFMALQRDFSAMAEKLTATGLYPFPVWVKYIHKDGRQMVILCNSEYSNTFATSEDAFFNEVKKAFGDLMAERFFELDKMAASNDAPIAGIVEAPTRVGVKSFLVIKWVVSRSGQMATGVAGLAIPIEILKDVQLPK